MQKDNTTKVLFIVSAIMLVALTRFVPHVANFTAVGAIAIFGGATLRNRWMALSIPVLAMFITDLVINNVMYAQFYDGFQLMTPGFGWTMLALAAMVLSGKLIIRKINALGVIGAGIAASLLFFLISNFGVWASSTVVYTKDFSGLLACYTAAIPFFLNTLLGTLAYSGILFGAFHFASSRLPQLANERA